MPEQDDTATRIPLDGNWTIAGIAGRQIELAAHLEILHAGREHTVAPPYSEICVGGMESIDACGCQLLVVFLRYMRQSGLVPAIVNIPEHIRSTVAKLGFKEELEVTGGSTHGRSH